VSSGNELDSIDKIVLLVLVPVMVMVMVMVMEMVMEMVVVRIVYRTSFFLCVPIMMFLSGGIVWYVFMGVDVGIR